MRFAAMGGTEGRDVDEFAPALRVLDDQVEVVRTWWALEVERTIAETRKTLDETEIGRKAGDLRFKLRAWRDGVQHGACVCALFLHPRERRRVQHFHVAVV